MNYLPPTSSQDGTDTYPFEPPSAAHQPSQKFLTKEEAEDSSKGRYDQYGHSTIANDTINSKDTSSELKDSAPFEFGKEIGFDERIYQDDHNYQARMASVDEKISSIDECRPVRKAMHGVFVKSVASASTISSARPTRQGLAPNQRTNTEVSSLNQQARQREREDKNRDVANWVCQIAAVGDIDPTQNTSSGRKSPGLAVPSGVELIQVALGDTTANNRIPEQIYYKTDGEGLTRTDKELMLTNRNWGDSPMLRDITNTRYQPESSQDAISKFNRQCQDNGSIVSHAATWGTRRRSLSSESGTGDSISGNILTKLSLDSSSRSPKILQRVTSISKRGDPSSKRKGGEIDKATSWEAVDWDKWFDPFLAMLSDDSDDDYNYRNIHNLPIGTQKPFDYSPDSGYDSINSSAYGCRYNEINAIPNNNYDHYEPLWKPPGQSRAVGQKVEANECCEICGWRPKGDPQWFKPSMAKHKKMKHPTNPPVTIEYSSCRSREPMSEPQILSPQKEERRADVKVVGSPTMQASKPLPHSQHFPIHLPQPNSIVQVGRAKIRVEELALYEYTDKSLGTASHSDDSSESTDEEHSLDGSGSCQDGENSNKRGNRTCDNANASSGSTTSNTSSGRSAGQKDQRNESSDGSRRDKRRRRDSKGPSDQKCQRLACPYQAYEKFQPCFRAGPRNPGGCNGLSRLKQHLHRRHNLLYRCKRCWQSFDSTVKLNEHESQEERCTIRTKPEYERFMTGDEAIEVGMISFSGSPWRVWWKLFQLLVPDMQNREIASLELSYSPYYVSSYMIPAVSVSFPNMIFQPMQAATGPEAMPDIRAPTSNSSTSFSMLDAEKGDTDPSAIFAVPPSGAQTMSLPLFEAFNFDSEPTSDPARVFTPSDSDANPSVSMTSILGSPWPTSTFSSPTSVGTPSQLVMGTSSSPEQQSQWRRNYDRLKSRSQLTETELSNMRDSNHESRADLDRVDAILEDVLGLESLPAHIYDRLIQASEIISTTRNKLR